MTNNDVFKLSDDYVMGTYGRFPVALKEGKGSTVYDNDGKKYIDFTSGIGVNSLGFCNDGWINSLTVQLQKIQHTSNYYYSEVHTATAEKLIKLSGMKKVFFSNSGAEANEGAIKLARKYSFDKYGEGRNVILSLKQSFHGRTLAALTATGQDSFHNYFFPFPEGFRYVEAGNIDAFKEEIIKKDVCAIFFELIQGESGVNIIDSDYVKQINALCVENDILFVVDEVQTGIGRTGKLFCSENYGVVPDIMTLAKGLGGGLPIGAFLCGEKLENTLGKGMHGSTFGGNPVVCAGANYILDTISDENFLAEVNKKGEYIRNTIRKMNKNTVKEVRGAGLMIGIQIDGEPKEYVKKALDSGLLALTAGTDVIRFLPPLNISNDEIEEGLAVINKVLD